MNSTLNTDYQALSHLLTTAIIKMSAQIDCPICMDCIETNKNCVTTECGHCFHASCLMQSVATNGFGCPYCRTAMAEVKDDDESTVYPGEEEEEEEEIEEDDMDLFRGFRLFWNNATGEEQDQEDVDEEVAYQENLASEDRDDDAPSTQHVADKLREQGVTFEQLVHMMCHLDHEEYHDEDQANQFGDDLFEKMRRIIEDFDPDQQVAPAEPAPQQTPTQVATPVPTVDFDAQPKIYSRRMMMIHV